ncbi:MAG TPA: hemolysin family protein [Dongiaceae bacterium]|nr:hemolysin family protein [Dongiaceae bacterium]
MDWNAVILLGLKIGAVAVLVFLNGFFVAAEFALVKIRDTQLNPLIEAGQRRAKVARQILQHLDAYLSATQLGITLASLALGWIGEPVFSALLHPVFRWLHIQSLELQHMLAVVIGFTAITFLHISAGEQAPKWMAIQKPLPTTLGIAYPMLWFYRISYPLVLALNWASQWLLRQLGMEPVGETEGRYSEDELRMLFTASRQQSGGTVLGRNIVLNALDLRRRVARDVMRPRLEIVALDTEAPMAECLELAEKTRYSRFPLCEGGDLDKMRGVVHFKDLFALRATARRGADLQAVTRKLIYVPETARLEKLLHQLLDRRLHVAVVVDEYGTTTGLVTLENILEELVGQIQDEFDQEKPLATAVDADHWLIEGALPLHELAELVGEPLFGEGVATASGWVTHRLGGFPKVGDSFAVGAFDLRVEQLDGVRVARLKLSRRPVPPPATE